MAVSNYHQIYTTPRTKIIYICVYGIQKCIIIFVHFLYVLIYSEPGTISLKFSNYFHNTLCAVLINNRVNQIYNARFCLYLSGHCVSSHAHMHSTFLCDVDIVPMSLWFWFCNYCDGTLMRVNMSSICVCVWRCVSFRASIVLCCHSKC